MSYSQTIAELLDRLTEELIPYVESRLRRVHGESWGEVAAKSLRERRAMVDPQDGTFPWDAQVILAVMWDQWNECFRQELDPTQRSFVNELRELRNRWAHQGVITVDDAIRGADTARRLLEAIGSPRSVKMDQLKWSLMQEAVNERSQVMHRKQRAKSIVNATLVTACGAAIVTQLLLTWPQTGWFLALFVAALFSLLAIDQVHPITRVLSRLLRT